MRDRTAHKRRTETRVAEYGIGERRQCELCEELRYCIDRFGLITCEHCEAEFLPSGWLLY